MPATLLDAVRIAGSLVGARLRFRLLSGTALAAYQNARAHKLLDFAKRHSSFHARRLENLPVTQWRELPPIEKKQMMDNFTDYNTVGVSLEQAMRVAVEAEESRDFTPMISGLTVGLSSGTSGHRGIFLVSELERLRWAGGVLSRTLPGIRLKGWSVAMFTRSNSNLYETLGTSWLRLQYFDLPTPLNVSVEKLNQFQPDVLVGPASLLSLLCREKASGRLRISPVRVISVAEVLEPHDKKTLEQAFGVPVHEIYQCTEGLIAACCKHGALHILEDVIAVDLEVLDEDDQIIRAIPIITDLWRTTQPIIRYRLNDVIVIKKDRCSCGSTFRVLAAIEGRHDDLIFARDMEGKLKPVFADLVRRVLLLASPKIKDYLVIQSALGNLDVYLDTESPEDFETLASSLRQRFQMTLASYDLVSPKITVIAGVPVRDITTKNRRVQRKFSMDSVEQAEAATA